ncbi:MAG: hypothetical protein FJ104_10855, partial [Deltaproteobacteria bacterium]|nr:hypothetical protein [Deltaproteobacteria bacterium]
MIQRGHHGARGGTDPGRRRGQEAGYQSTSVVSLAVAGALVIAACAGGAGGRPPVPALSSDPRAQEAHARLEEQWAATPPEARVTLEAKLREYLAEHGEDGRAPWAELRLASLDLGRGRLLAAARVAARLRARPPGPVRDLADLVLASAYRRQGRLPEARALLEALDGKLIDPGDRAVLAEELVRVRIASGDVRRALSGMLAWTESTSAADRELALSTIEALLRTVPDEALERGLTELDRPLDGPTTRETDGARRWLASVLRRRLADLALTRPDAALARRLLASMPPRLGKDEIRDALVALAATSATAASVAGRALGVVLEVGDPDTRRRAAELSRGVAAGLGL